MFFEVMIPVALLETELFRSDVTYSLRMTRSTILCLFRFHKLHSAEAKKQTVVFFINDITNLFNFINWSVARKRYEIYVKKKKK